MEKKVAIVTGGLTGIGLGIVKVLIQNNYFVITISRVIDKLNSSEISNDMMNLEAYQCDLSIRSMVDDITSKIIRKYKKIDCLINNAGIDYGGEVTAIDFECWKKVIDVNINGTMYLTKLILENMRNYRNGNLVFISSLGSTLSWKGDAAYQTSKAAMEAFSRSIAVDYAEYGIRSNCIKPGVINAPLFLASLEREHADMKEFMEKIPLKRLGEPSDIAYLVEFLCSDKSSYITGETIVIDGGYSIYDD